MSNVARSLCMSVCWPQPWVSPARTAEPVKMPLGMWTHGRQWNHVLDGARIPLPDGMGTCASPYAHSTVYGLCVWIECVCGCSYICEFAAAMRPLTKLILTLFSCILAASELCSERRRCGEVSGHMVGESILSTRCPHWRTRLPGDCPRLRERPPWNAKSRVWFSAWVA